MRHKDRFYRSFSDTERWCSFHVKLETTDLLIRAEKDLSAEAEELVRNLRNLLRNHINDVPSFISSFSPIGGDISEYPEIIRNMYTAAAKAGVGPMAAVAGAIAEAVGKELLTQSSEVIVENGGDIWLSASNPVEVSCYGGDIYFTDAVTLSIKPEDTPCGICTSSATIGQSFSYGKADAASAVAESASLADAIATEMCNRISDRDDITESLQYAIDTGATGAIGVFHGTMGIQGNIQLVNKEG